MIDRIHGLAFTCVILLHVGGMPAAEIRCTVTDVSGDVVTIALPGQQAPSVGNKVLVFGQIPGLETEVLVGRGKVTEVRTGNALAKIDARGRLAAGQTARITLAPAPAQTPTAEPPPSPPAGRPARIVSEISGATGSRNLRELAGKVAAVNGPHVTIAVEGDTLPMPGDALEVFGEGPGGLTRMGSGRVIEVRNRDVLGSVEQSTGTIRRYQLVKIAARAPNACEIFAIELVWLATPADAEPNKITSSVSYAEHLAWAEQRPVAEFADKLTEEYALQFDKHARQGVESACHFYARASARLAAYGIDLGDPGSNLRQQEPHFTWAQRQTTHKMREAIGEKVVALLRGAPGGHP